MLPIINNAKGQIYFQTDYFDQNRSNPFISKRHFVQSCVPTKLVELKNGILLTVAVIDGNMLYSTDMCVVTPLTCLLPYSGDNVEHLLL